MITKHQLNLYNIFGFVPLRKFFSQAETKVFNEEIQLKLESTLRYTEPQNKKQYCSWSNLGPQTPHLAALIEDERILSVAEQILGPNCIGRSCNSGSYIHNTGWHPDCRDFNVRLIKFAIYIQSLNEENGALRFIIGSHKPPLHHEINKTDYTNIKGIPAFICNSNPGDIFIFNCFRS